MDKKVEYTVNTLEGTPDQSIDWRPYLTPVTDQGAHPTCYAWSVISMAEAVYYKKNPS